MRRRRSPTAIAGAAALLASLLQARPAPAWLFAEHTSVGRAALAGGDEVVSALSSEERAALEGAWAALRKGEAAEVEGLSLQAGEPDTAIEREARPGEAPFSTQIDLPMLAALAGDHSCSPDDLVATLRSGWVPPLVRMFAGNYEAIRRTPLESPRRISLWHESHLRAQGIDDEYLFRAASSHFVLARLWIDGAAGPPRPEELADYAQRVSAASTPLNAVGVYVTFHARALAAAAAGRCNPAGCAAPKPARDALLLEAMALHFLEDAFSSGHVAGGPQDASRAARLGTHDYYCQHGLSVQTWGGKAYPAYGDAHLRAQDKMWTSRAVRQSLAELARALDGVATPCSVGAASEIDVCQASAPPETPEVPDACRNAMQAPAMLPAPPLVPTPLPPSRSDIGAFVRFAMSADGGLGSTASTTPPNPPPGRTVPTWGVDADLGIGLTFAGVTTGRSDAVAFVEGGLSGVAGQRADFCFSCSVAQQPLDTRLGWDVRVRMPFDFVPGDFLILGSASLLGSRWAYKQLLEAANGGAYGRWQAVHVFPNGMALEIVVGREAAYSQYNVSRPLGTTAPTTTASLTHSRSLTLPVLDWIWTRHFAEQFGSALGMRLSYRVEYSNLITTHFALLSFDSDSDLYFTGF
jgi:hypothetical protein